MLLARISCSPPSPSPCSPTLLLSIVFVAVKKKEGGMGTGHVRCYKRHKLFCSRVASSAAFRVAIRSNIAKDTEYIY